MITGTVTNAGKREIEVEHTEKGAKEATKTTYPLAPDVKYISAIGNNAKQLTRDAVKTGTKVALHGVPKGKIVHSVRVLSS